jgi:hypothetical protein
MGAGVLTTFADGDDSGSWVIVVAWILPNLKFILLLGWRAISSRMGNSKKEG